MSPSRKTRTEFSAYQYSSTFTSILHRAVCRMAGTFRHRSTVHDRACGVAFVTDGCCAKSQGFAYVEELLGHPEIRSFDIAATLPRPGDSILTAQC